MNIPSDGVFYGRNAENTAYRDDRYVRCQHCGWICHLDRDQRVPRGSRSGDGISFTNITGTPDDPVVVSGCPQCGCLIYDSGGNDG